MMALTEELVAGAARHVAGGTSVEYQGASIDLAPPWRRVTMAELVERKKEITQPKRGDGRTARRHHTAKQTNFSLPHSSQGFHWKERCVASRRPPLGVCLFLSLFAGGARR